MAEKHKLAYRRLVIGDVIKVGDEVYGWNAGRTDKVWTRLSETDVKALENKDFRTYCPSIMTPMRRKQNR